MPCLKAGKQQKIVIDVVLSIDAPDFEFKLAVKVKNQSVTVGFWEMMNHSMNVLRKSRDYRAENFKIKY